MSDSAPDDESMDGGSVDWDALDPADLTAFDMSEVPDDALPTDTRCPKCHWPVFQVTMTEPTTRVLGPCGCRVGTDP
ncbi:hypothetical protein [Halovivax cerinus]|uniref:Small CPxCG-related zinc finger protein n=1 Tax=Halovivax cerinus TaxID=1487865 RepID=A0ABD5NLP2_9EURY|nr:hypothetical protein [Halovivax cerinus]